MQGVLKLSVDEIIDEIIADIVAGTLDLDDTEIEAKIDTYGLDPNTKAEVMQIINDVSEADALADLDNALGSYDEAFGNESGVTITEEDSDDDGDLDKVTVSKNNPVDNSDDVLTDEDRDEIAALLGNASNEGDSPHKDGGDNSTNNFAKVIGSFKY